MEGMTKNKYNFPEEDLKEWDLMRKYIAELLQKKCIDVKISCTDKSLEV